MQADSGRAGTPGDWQSLRPEGLLRPRQPSPPAAPAPAAPSAPGPLPEGPLPGGPQPPGPGGQGSAPAGGQRPRPLPLLPGFREMAARRAGTARQIIAELAVRRQSAGLSQTRVAARMGTSQSAVARLEAGDADVRVSTLERYAAAVGSRLSWQLHGHGTNPGREEPR